MLCSALLYILVCSRGRWCPRAAPRLLWDRPWARHAPGPFILGGIVTSATTFRFTFEPYGDLGVVGGLLDVQADCLTPRFIHMQNHCCLLFVARCFTKKKFRGGSKVLRWVSFMGNTVMVHNAEHTHIVICKDGFIYASVFILYAFLSVCFQSTALGGLPCVERRAQARSTRCELAMYIHGLRDFGGIGTSSTGGKQCKNRGGRRFACWYIVVGNYIFFTPSRHGLAGWSETGEATLREGQDVSNI